VRYANKLQTTVRRAYFVTVIDGVFCVDVRVINRYETRFNRRAWPEWDYGRFCYNTADTVVGDRRTKYVVTRGMYPRSVFAAWPLPVSHWLNRLHSSNFYNLANLGACLMAVHVVILFHGLLLSPISHCTAWSRPIISADNLTPLR